MNNLSFEYEDEILSGDENAIICGVDEAGRGPLAGRVYAAAVIFPRNCVSPYDSTCRHACLVEITVYVAVDECIIRLYGQAFYRTAHCVESCGEYVCAFYLVNLGKGYRVSDRLVFYSLRKHLNYTNYFPLVLQ